MSLSNGRAGVRLNVDHAGFGYRGAGLDTLRGAGVPEAVLLAAYKADAQARVDAEAEALRARVMTSGAGQAMEYQEAATQAFAALDAAPETVTDDRFPMLAASVGIDVDPQTGAVAVDVLGVARSVKRAYLQWQGLGSAIRGARLTAKAAIAAAADIAAVDAVAPVWPSLS